MNLTIENLGKTYPNGVRALENFSLTLSPDDFVTVVGPSGCGKSTLLRLLAGLEKETCGTILLGNKSLNGLAPKDRDIAIVFQNYTLLPHLTVSENLEFGLKIRGISQDIRKKHIEETSVLLGLESLLQRYPAEISGGERQRTALGRAILRKPKLFLFDEPLSSLDAQMRLQLRVEIQRVHRLQATPMLFVTHDQSEALTLGKRVVVMHQGKIQQIADPETLYRKPANAFVASFIGNPGMNLFPGRLEKRDMGLFFQSPALNFSLNEEQIHLVTKSGNRDTIQVGIRPEHFLPTPTNPIIQGVVVAEERHISAEEPCLFFQSSQQNGSGAFAVRGVKFEKKVDANTCLGFTCDKKNIVFFENEAGTRLDPG